MNKNPKADITDLEKKEGFQQTKDSLWTVYLRRFKKHKLGQVGFFILVFFYFVALFADFISPYSMRWTDKTKSYHPPSKIHFFYNDGEKKQFKPYVYEKKLSNVMYKKYGVIPEYSLRAISVETIPNGCELRSVSISKDKNARKDEIINSLTSYFSLHKNRVAREKLLTAIDELESNPQKDLIVDIEFISRNKAGLEEVKTVKLIKGNKNFLSFFNKGIPYNFLGLFVSDRHFFGSETGGYYFLGNDALGRDLWSRLLHGSRISLSVGIAGVIISFFIGLLIGGIAGYFGGIVDTILMRFSEIVLSFPSIYLLFTLRAALPTGMSSTKVYLLIIIILAFVGWASLARIIRGMVLSLRNEDYVLSAKTVGLSDLKIIIKHILPNTLSFIIVQATLTIPGYILGESALSMLGLGITEPQSSWGNMLSVARNYRIVQDFPWVLIPGVAIFLSIMAWNFFGDGVRDAVDPKSKH